VSADEATDPGATADGLLILGEDYVSAAEAVAKLRSLNAGPTRLLCLHACELFLKAFLRKRGFTHDQLRGLMHNLAEIARAAAKHGLDIDRSLARDLETITEIKADVDTRYRAASDHGPFSSRDATIRLATRVRDLVRSDFAR
jgi:hypothetical protein